MKFVRPKVIGTLKIQKMMAGNLAVLNDIKNSTNRICIPCRSEDHGQEIMEKIKQAKAGEMLFL